MSKATKPRTLPTINPNLPEEPVDKPLDTKALEEALKELHGHTEKRAVLRHCLGNGEAFTKEFAVYLLQGEEQYLQSLKNKVAALIQGATRIA